MTDAFARLSNRGRFTSAVLLAVHEIIIADVTGGKLCPGGTYKPTDSQLQKLIIVLNLFAKLSSM